MNDVDHERKDRAKDFRDRCALPTCRGKRVVGRRESFFAALFVQRVEEGALVRKAPVERGDRGVGAECDFADMDVIEILVAKKDFGDIEQTFENLVGSRLSREPITTKRNRIPVSVWESTVSEIYVLV